MVVCVRRQLARHRFDPTNAARTADAGEDFVGSLAGQTVSQDDGVLSRHGRIDETSHGEGRGSLLWAALGRDWDSTRLDARVNAAPWRS